MAELKHKLLHGHKFVMALVDAGLLPRGTTSVRITAGVDEPTWMEYACIADERLLGLAAKIETTDDEGESYDPPRLKPAAPPGE
jgi:hypothetical protein